MKRLTPALALTLLAAAPLAIAQTPQTPARPPADSQPDPATQPSDPGPGTGGGSGQMQDCMTQTQAAHPEASKDAIRMYCENQMKKSPQH